MRDELGVGALGFRRLTQPRQRAVRIGKPIQTTDLPGIDLAVSAAILIARAAMA